MKNLILYNYGIDPEDLIRINDYDYSFYINYTKYIFSRTNRSNEELINIYNLSSLYINKFYQIIKNINGKIFIQNEEYIYILLKATSPENDEVMLKDILQEEILIEENKNKLLNREKWSLLWSSKIDYLEYQISELGKNHKIATKSFSYYVGLAENAITYFNLLKIENAPLAISHKRTNFPNFSKEYYNPLNMIIDYRIRDISEYIKSSFFNNNLEIDKEIDYLINKNILSPSEYNLLFIRLLYPSYYFDTLTNVLEDNESEEKLISYINKYKEYENFLNKIYNKINKKNALIKIDWLIKKEL